MMLTRLPVSGLVAAKRTVVWSDRRDVVVVSGVAKVVMIGPFVGWLGGQAAGAELIQVIRSASEIRKAGLRSEPRLRQPGIGRTAPSTTVASLQRLMVDSDCPRRSATSFWLSSSALGS